ncbi:MAG: ribonuclease R [Gammaproteobacteria bacterium]|nr:MAG: ribonuclease R [Gammaproteobacteria bacterium]
MSTRKKHKKNKKKKDPQAGRETGKYRFPIASREYIMETLKKTGAPMSIGQLSVALDIKHPRDKIALQKRLRAMERDGQLLKNRKDMYGLIQRMELIRGRIIGHPDGFGFIHPEQGGDDLFLSPREMRQVLHGDVVLARVRSIDKRGRLEGTIVEVLEHTQKDIAGHYRVEHNMSFVEPEDRRLSQNIIIPPECRGEARTGQIVVVHITRPPSKRAQPVGKIVEVLGDHMAPGMEIDIAIHKHDVPYQWPDSVIKAAKYFSTDVDATAKQNRLDLRELPLLTIDGEDARDFDDAVYCEPTAKGWRLIVAIADVSYYVQPRDALDKEAYQRGNSVYFPLRVIPMLPEVLSNELCSLKPDVDRLCMACDMQISKSGELMSYHFHEAVMRSHARMTYDKVAAILVDKDSKLIKQYQKLLPQFQNLYALYKVLHKQRLGRGAIDFEIPETRIVYNDEHKIERVEPTIRNDAHRLIEECMLVANISAALYIKKHKALALNRIHEGPNEEKLSDLREFLFELGLSMGGGDEPQAMDYARLLHEARERPDIMLVQSVLLRSLSQAMYSPDDVGHFALAFPSYAHFTSPIRRYPDLIVHRTIKGILNKEEHPGLPPETAHAVGEHCSMTERRADDATRDVIRWLKAEFMQDKIGEEFDGIISGVTNFGVFVELKDIYVDGLVHITSLGNDYYIFDATKHRLIGERTKETYRLGDAVRVQLVRVDLDEAKIDFELVQHGGSVSSSKNNSRKLKKRSSKTQ